MALNACGETAIQYRVPTLNEADHARLSCAEYPEIREALAELPPHAFLSGSSGEPVVTPDGRKWVAFDVVNQREGALIKFGDVAGRSAHFECRDDLGWVAEVWTELER